MNRNISCCGTDCGICSFYGSMCIGCEEARGRVFHAPEGKACPIYDCCRLQHEFSSCGACKDLPCGIILGTRDPGLSEEAFLKTVEDRVNRLKGDS